MAEQLQLVKKNALFLLRNLALGVEGTTVTTTSQHPVGSMFASNLLSPALDSPWRSGSLADNLALPSPLAEFRLRFKLGEPETVNAVAFHGSNIRLPIRALFYSQDPESSAADFDSDWVNPIILASMRDFGWRDMPWTLGPRSSKLKFWQQNFQLTSLIVADRDYYGVQWVDLLFDVSEEQLFLQLADYLQFSLPTIARALQPPVNVLLGWSLGVDDTSITHRTESGSLRGRHRAKLKTFAFTLAHAGLFNPGGSEGRQQQFRLIYTELANDQGRLGRVFVWPEPKKPAFFYDQAFLGTSESLPSIVMAHSDLPDATGWVIKETE